MFQFTLFSTKMESHFFERVGVELVKYIFYSTTVLEDVVFYTF